MVPHFPIYCWNPPTVELFLRQGAVRSERKNLIFEYYLEDLFFLT